MSMIHIRNYATYTEEEAELRASFMYKAYGIASLLLGVGVLQLLLVMKLSISSPFADSPNLILIPVCVGLVLVLLFGCVSSIRNLFPINWIMIVAMLECYILYVTYYVNQWEPVTFYVIVAIGIVVEIVVVVLASKMPCDLTAESKCLTIIAYSLAIGCFVLFVVRRFVKLNYLDISFNILVIVMIIFVLMMFAQSIQGERYSEVKLDQVPLTTYVITVIWAAMCNSLMQIYKYVGK